jgi:site-specific DNA-methyltransferase (adenine-specific)
MEYVDQIICDDCQKVIAKLPDNSVDLVVTSPPYNVNLGKNKYNKNQYDLHDDNMEHGEYVSWLTDVFRDFYPKMKVGGRVCININDGQNGRIPTVQELFNKLTEDVGYLPFAHIIWDKAHTSNRAAWGSYLSPSCPSFPTPFERIVVFAKESTKLQDKGETDLTKKEFVEWANSLWKFKTAKKSKHPAAFPIELPSRLIKMLSWKGAFVVDPFNGGGTTTLACRTLDRKYLGVDISEDYCEMARQRIIDNTTMFDESK